MIKMFERTRAKPVLAYHGTCDIFLREILKKGMVPDPAKRTWGEDPQASAMQISRVSLPGSYWTTNLMTAKSSSTTTAKKLEGNPLFIIAYVMPETGVADEDSMLFDFISEIGGRFEIFRELRTIAKVWGEIYKTNKRDFIKKKYDEAIKILHNKWAINPDLKPIPYKEFYNMIDTYIERQTWASYKEYSNTLPSSSVLYEWKRGFTEVNDIDWDSVPEPEDVLESKNMAEAENNFKKVQDDLGRYYREIALQMRGDEFNPTMRILEPVTYSGRNRIICIVRVTPLGTDKYKDELEVVYGEVPTQFIKDWEARVGEARWRKK